MDQNKRLVISVLLCAAILIGWTEVIRPLLFPTPPAQRVALDEQQDAADAAIGEGSGVSETPTAEPSQESNEHPKQDDWVAPRNPARWNIALGTLEPDAGYFQEVVLTSRGAAVKSIALNDPRYKTLADRSEPLEIVSPPSGQDRLSLTTAIKQFDQQLAAFDLDSTEVDWKVERTIPDATNPEIQQGIVFSLVSPDGSLKATKTYRLKNVKQSTGKTIRDTNPTGYQLEVSLEFQNLGETPQEVTYVLQGPVGLPLENQEHTSKFRQLELGFLARDGELNSATITASAVTDQYRAARIAQQAEQKAEAANRELAALQKRLASLRKQAAEGSEKSLQAEIQELAAQVDAQQTTARQLTDRARDLGTGLERWSNPYRYIGVEDQYFTALLFSGNDRPLPVRYKNPWIAIGEPVVVDAVPDEPQFNGISFQLTSTPITVAPGDSVSRSWTLYAGPKRQELLEPLGAAAVLDFGWFSWISRAMLWILEELHWIGLPYWLAIICLTVLVRGTMFPVSRKQAIGAAKMKELQPKLTALKERYGKDQEKMLKAQMELFRKHGYGPLGPMASGCLPVVLQLPIFFGLYRALQTSVDLRLQSFLWIDNLAAPDQMFEMPFSLPYLGSDFNLLPLLTVTLYYFQQKLFMPPPVSDEQKMQYKMMNFMMLGMGFFFYHVPAGLCLYFIASSLWSISERTLLTRTKAAHIGESEAEEIEHELEEIDRATSSDKGKGKEKGKDKNKPKNKSFAKPASRPGKNSGKTSAKGGKKPSFLEKLLDAAENAKKEAELANDNKKKPPNNDNSNNKKPNTNQSNGQRPSRRKSKPQKRS